MRFTTIEAADAYFATRLHTDAWDELGSSIEGINTKTKALNHAESIVLKLEYTVMLIQLPTPPETTPMPQTWLTDAIYEIALSLLDGIDPDKELSLLQQTGSTIANVKSTYDRSSAFEHTLAGVPSATAWRLLRPYLVDANVIRLVRSG